MTKAPKVPEPQPVPQPVPLPHSGGVYVVVDGALRREDAPLNPPVTEA